MLAHFIKAFVGEALDESRSFTAQIKQIQASFFAAIVASVSVLLGITAMLLGFYETSLAMGISKATTFFGAGLVFFLIALTVWVGVDRWLTSSQRPEKEAQNEAARAQHSDDDPLRALLLSVIHAAAQGFTEGYRSPGPGADTDSWKNVDSPDGMSEQDLEDLFDRTRSVRH